MATRCLDGPGPQGQHMRGLYNHTMCDRLGRPYQGSDRCQAVNWPINCFLSSLCEAGRQAGCTLVRKGAVAADIETEIGFHPDVDSWPQGVRNFVLDYKVHFTAELVEWDTGAISDWVFSSQRTGLDTRSTSECLRNLLAQVTCPAQLPLRRGYTLEFNWSGTRRYFEISGYLNDEHMLGGRWYTECADDGRLIPEIPDGEGQWAAGCGRCDLLLVERYKPALAFRRHRSNGSRDEYISGRNFTIQWCTSMHRRLGHTPPIAPWTQRVLAAADSTGRTIDCLTSDASITTRSVRFEQLWEGPADNLRRQGAIVGTDRNWRDGKGCGKGPVMAIVITNYPDSLQGYSNGAELVASLGLVQYGCAHAQRHQVQPPAMETDCKSIILRGTKENSRYGKRSLNCRRHGYLYQYLRRVHRQWPKGVRRWVRSHPERRKGVGEYTGPDARIVIADKYAGSDDPERVTAALHSAQFKSCKYEVMPEIVVTVEAQEILEAAFSERDFYWAEGLKGCPLPNPLQAKELTSIGKYLQERTKHANTGSKYLWHRSQVGLLKHMWTKAKHLKSGWDRWAAIQDVWDKRNHGRNMAKGEEGAAHLCPLCQLMSDSQAHYVLSCKHPLFTLARSGFKKKVFSRIEVEEDSIGKECLKERWEWVFNTSNDDTVKHGMNRMAFILGRPTHMAFAHTSANQEVSRKAREGLTVCITELWLDTLKYMKNLWSLRRSVLAAPIPVQDRLRVTAATTADIRGMLTKPYYQRDRKKRSRALRQRLARFCTVRGCPPPMREQERACVDEHRSEEHAAVDEDAEESLRAQETACLQTWMQWWQGAGRQQQDTSINFGNDNNQAQERTLEPCQEEHTDGAGVGPAERRRNPPRASRPPEDIDLGEWGFFLTPNPSCGRIASSAVDGIKQSEGPVLRRHVDDHPLLWCRESVCCPGANKGLYFEIKGGGRKRGHLVAVYDGDSCDSLNIPYRKAMERWSGGDYVLSNSAYRYVVNGNLSCGAARANDSFGDANTFLYFNPHKRRVELRLAVDLPDGFYEALVNYTAPHQESAYWTEDRIALLPAETQKIARKFYRRNVSCIDI